MYATLALRAIRWGSPAAAPPTTRIILRQGETAAFDCSITWSDDASVFTLDEGSAVQFAASRNGAVVLSRLLTVVNGTEGTCTLQFAVEDTVSLDAGEYACDVWATLPDGSRIPLSSITLRIEEARVKPDTLVTALPNEQPLGLGPVGPQGPPGEGLPDVGTEGQVLTVVDGGWAAADPTGGGGGEASFPAATADDVGKELVAATSGASPTAQWGNAGVKLRRCYSRLVHCSGRDVAGQNLTADVFALPYKWPSDVTRVRIVLAARDLLKYAPNNPDWGNAVDYPNIKFAIFTANDTNDGIVGTGIEVTGITIPAVGEHYISEEIDLSSVPPNAQGVRMLLYGPVPTGIRYRQYANRYGFKIPNTSSVLSMAGAVPCGDDGVNNGSAAWAVSTIYDTRKIAITMLHDSLFTGLAAGVGECGFFNSLGRDLPDYAISKNGVTASQASEWFGDYTNEYLRDGWTSTGCVKDQNVIIAIGHNDLALSSLSAVNLKRYVLSGIQQAWALGARRVIVGTIATSGSLTGSKETERVKYNKWVLGLPDHWDIAAVIAGIGPTAFAADGIHWKSAAHRALETSLLTLGLT